MLFINPAYADIPSDWALDTRTIFDPSGYRAILIFFLCALLMTALRILAIRKTDNLPIPHMGTRTQKAIPHLYIGAFIGLVVLLPMQGDAAMLFYLPPLLLTLIIETIYVRLASRQTSLSLVVSLNILTNPAFNFLLYSSFQWHGKAIEKAIFSQDIASCAASTGDFSYICNKIGWHGLSDFLSAPWPHWATFWGMLIALELIVVAVEGYLLSLAYPGQKKKMFLLSLGMNAASLLLGGTSLPTVLRLF